MKYTIPTSGILISTANIEQLQLIIDAAEGRAQKRCVSASTVIDAAEEAEERFAPLCVTKAERIGATMTITAAGPGKSYTWRAEGTEVEMIRRSKGWYLSVVRRVRVFPGNDERRRFQLTEKQKEAALARFRMRLAVV